MPVRIPIYDQQVTSFGAGREMPRAYGVQVSGAVGEELSRIGQIGGALVERMQAEDEVRRKEAERSRKEEDAEMRRQAHEDAKVWTADATSTMRLDWTRHLIERQEKVEGNAAGFADSLLKDFDAAAQKLIASAPEAAKPMISMSMANFRDNLGIDAARFERGARLDWRKDTLTTATGNAARVVLADPGQVRAVLAEQLDMIDEAQLPPVIKSALRDSATQQLHTAALNGHINRARGSVAALDRILEGITSGKIEAVPANQLAVAESRIIGYRAGLIAKQEAEERRREAAGRRWEAENAKMWQQAVDLVGAGKNLSPAFLDQLSKRFGGTSYGKALNELLKEAPATQAFSARPLVAQQQAMQGLLAKGNDPARGWTPAEQKQYTRLEGTYRATLADVQRDPINAALERGVIAAPPAPLDLSNLNGVLPQITARREMTNTITLWTGRQASPLTSAEAAKLADVLAQQPPDNRAQWLGAISSAVGNPAGMRALSAQMGAKSTALVTAGAYAAGNLRTSANRSVAELYLRGEDAIRQGTAKMDTAKETGIKATIYKELEGVYLSPPALDAAADASMKIYAALKAEGRDDVQQAVTIATGGVTKWNGQRVLRPYGWTDGQFRDAVNGLTPEDLYAAAGGAQAIVGSKAMSAGELARQLPRARLRSAGADGEYAVIVGADMVRRADGSPLTLKLRLRDVR